MFPHFGDIGISIDEINGILITHEHVDHTKGLLTISTKYNIPIYANEKTWDSLNSMLNKMNLANKKIFKTLEPFKLGNLKIFPFPIPHDANAPVGFNIYNKNKKLSIVTDVGYISEKLYEYLENSSSILLEANYDPEILKFSRYPYALKRRIASNNGHLSNVAAGKTIANLYNTGLNKALLVHLSKENNFPELAYETILSEIHSCKDISINIAPRNNPSEMFEVS